MQAETLNCPMCGAASTTDATRCEHCGAQLAKVACPSCFGMIFDGAKFCSHCGAQVMRSEVTETQPRPCPRCHINLTAAVVGATQLLECSKCEGIWLDANSFQQICADREKQAAVLGMPSPVATNDTEPFDSVRYVPCPVCQKLMNRVRFAQCSHVIVDVCLQHGTWFDKDELRKVIGFIRAGGLEKSRAREIAELEQKRSALSTNLGGGSLPDISIQPARYDGYEAAFDVVWGAIRWFMK